MNKAKRFSHIIFMTVLVTLLSVSISTVKASQSTAPAASLWQLSDSFEGALWARWGCWHTVEEYPANGCTYYNGTVQNGSAHTGNQSGIISARNGWSDIGRTVILSPLQAVPTRKLTCTAKIYLSPFVLSINGISGQMDVIDIDSWRYITIKKFHLINTLNWTSATTVTWTPPRPNIYIRIGMTGDGVVAQKTNVDDLTVQCSY